MMVMRQQSGNFLLNMKLQVCKGSVQKYCKNLPWTKVIGCLLDVLHHKELPGDCKTALVDEQEKRSKSIDFNPTLADDCRADIDSLLYGGVCQDTTSDKGKGVKFEGRLIRCLLDHKEKVTRTDCKFAIVKIMQRQSNDWRANFNMVRACSPDVEFLCPDVTEGFGRVHECLRENFARVESQQCKQIVQSMNKTEHEDARINPRVHEKCDKDAKKFCRSTVPGHARLIICLSLHWNRDGFSADCKAALKSLNIDDKLAKVDKRNKEQAVIVQPFVAEMMDLLSRSSESWGVGGVLGSFLMLWAFGVLTVLSVLLVRRKCCGSSQAFVRHLAL
jgi:Golgi apparatus protein 1